MLRMEEMRCLSDDYDVDIDRVDLKGCIRGGGPVARSRTRMNDVSNTVHRDHTRLQREPQEICSLKAGLSAIRHKLTSVALRVVPVAGPTGNIPTIHKVKYEFICTTKMRLHG